MLFPRVPVEEAISKIAELGADCVEVIFDMPHFPPDFDMGGLRQLRKLVDSYGLDVSVHGPIWDMNPASYYGEVRELAFKHVKRAIDTCSSLGGEIVVMHPGRCPTPQLGKLLSAAKSRFIKFTSECLEYSKKREVKLTLENFSMSNEHPYSYLRQMVPLARKLDGLGITFDVGHAFIGKRRDKISNPEQEIAEEIRLVGKHLTHLHIHDNHGEWDEHLPPGEGEMDFGPIIKALKHIEYDERVIAELHNPNTRKPMEIGRTGLKKVRDLFRTN